MMVRTYAFVLLAAAALSGCAGEQKPFDVAAYPDVKGILLPLAGQPQIYGAENAGVPYWLLGGIPGALAGEAIETHVHGEPFTESVRSRGSDLGAALTASVEEELARTGVPVVAAETTTPRPAPDAFFSDYRQFAQNGPHNIVLDIVVSGAGYRGTFVLPYRPYMRVDIQLVDPSSRRTLYTDRLEVDPTAGTVGYRLIGRPPGDCSFSTRDDLMANISKAGDCLQNEGAQIARAIADVLHPR